MLGNELCAQASNAHAQSPGQEAESPEPLKLGFQVDGVPMMLLKLSGAQEGHAILCAECGQIPLDREADVLRTVLNTNMPFYRDSGASFCTNPLTGELLLLGRVWLASAVAEDVREMARQFARGVQRFRQDYFGTGQGSGSLGQDFGDMLPVLRG